MKYICELCGTVYDEDAGNIRRGIPAGTPFDELPAHYHCPGCGCEKEAFTPVKGQKQSIPIKQVSTSGQYVKYFPSWKESQR